MQFFKIEFLLLFFVGSKNATVNQKSFNLPSKQKKKVIKSDKNCLKISAIREMCILVSTPLNVPLKST